MFEEKRLKFRGMFSPAKPQVPLKGRLGKPKECWTIESMKTEWESIQTACLAQPHAYFDPHNCAVREILCFCIKLLISLD